MYSMSTKFYSFPLSYLMYPMIKLHHLIWSLGLSIIFLKKRLKELLLGYTSLQKKEKINERKEKVSLVEINNTHKVVDYS